MANGKYEPAQQASRRVNARSWLEGIFGLLGLAWFVFFVAAGLQFGPLVTLFERYRVIFGGLDVLGSLVVVCASLQIPPFRQRPFSWPTSAYNIVSGAACIFWTYWFEATLFPTFPDPSGGAMLVGALLAALGAFGGPTPFLTWIYRRVRVGHVPQAPANPV